MAKYRVKLGKKGYIYDQMLEAGRIFTAADDFKYRKDAKGEPILGRDGKPKDFCTWAESVEAPLEASSDDPPTQEPDPAPEKKADPLVEPEAQAGAMEDAASESQGSRPDPALAAAEVAAGDQGDKDLGVEVL